MTGSWYVFVLLIGLYADGTQDTYLYTEPSHESLETCQSWVQSNASGIRRDMMVQFGGKSIDRVYCMREDKLKRFLLLNDGAQET